MIIPKSDTKTVKDIQNAVEQAKQDGKAKFGGRIPANLKLPLRDGDIERPDDEAYKDLSLIHILPGIMLYFFKFSYPFKVIFV